MTERVELIGEWKGSVYEKWAFRYLSTNMWRIQHQLGDMDDAMSEAFIEFHLMKRDYGEKVNSPRQFMSLFQLCLRSHVNNISMKDSKNRKALTSIEAKEPAIQPDAEITTLLNESSPELVEILKIFFNAPVEIMETLRKDASSCSPKQFWNRVLDYCKIPRDHSPALMKELEDRLS